MGRDLCEQIGYLHGVLFAINSVFRAGDRSAIPPVQMELQGVIGAIEGPSAHIEPPRCKVNLHWKT